MAIDTIKSTAVLDGAIATADIADDAVTADKLANAINTSIAAKAPTASPVFTGNVGIGESSVDSKFHVKNSLSSTGVGSSSSPIAIIQNERVNTGASSSVLRFDTNEIAGTNQYARAAIGAEYDDSSNVNGRLMFSTADTSGNLQERVRILSGGGITFNGDTAADNALNDYEEGRFDFLVADSDGGSETLSMRYTKVGQVVHVEGPNRGAAGSSAGQYALLSNTANSNINITSSLPYVPIESGSAISPIHRSLELRSDGTSPTNGYWRPMLTWQAGSATLVLADTRGSSAGEHAYWGGVNGSTLRKADNRTNVVVGFNFSYRTAS